MPDNFTLDQGFYDKCFRSAKNVMIGEEPSGNTPLDVSTARYAAIRPRGISIPQREPWFERPMEQAAKMAAAAAASHITSNFDIYTKRYFKLKCTPENGPLAEMPTAKFNSLMSVGWKALEEGGNVMELAQSRKALKGILSEEHAAFVQEVVDNITQELPKINKHGAALKFLYKILGPLHQRGEELRIQAGVESMHASMFNVSTENGESSRTSGMKRRERNSKRRLKGKHAFALLPQYKVRAHNIRIASDCLEQLLKAIAARRINTIASDGVDYSGLYAEMLKAASENASRLNEMLQPLYEEERTLLEPCESAKQAALHQFDAAASGSIITEALTKKRNKVGAAAFDAALSALAAQQRDRVSALTDEIDFHGYERDTFLWKGCFNFTKVMNAGAIQQGSRSPKRFAKSIMTDGIGVSVLLEAAKSSEQLENQKVATAVVESKMKHKIAVAKAKANGEKIPRRAKTQAEKDQEKRREEKKQELHQKALEITGLKKLPNGLHTVDPGVRIVGIDPGKRKPVTLAVHSPEAEEHLHGGCECETCHDSSHVRFVTGCVTKGEWNHRCGFTRRNKQMLHWLNRDSTGVSTLQSAPSSAVSSLDGYISRCKAILERLDVLKKFYVACRRVRRLKFNTHMRTQSAYQWLVSEICGTSVHSEQAKTVVGYGDACMSRNTKGTAPMASSRIVKALSERAKVIMTDEFRSSKLCSSCYQEMEGELVEDDEGNQSRSFGLRRCSNSDCLCTLWDRDCNASITICLTLIRNLCGEEVPEEFRRKETGEPVVEMPHTEDVLAEEEINEEDDVIDVLLSI